MDIRGTKTQENLLRAFNVESEAKNKYEIYAAKAKKDARHLPRAVFLGKRRTPLSVAKKYTPHPAESQDAFAQHSGTSCRNNFTRGFQ